MISLNVVELLNGVLELLLVVIKLILLELLFVSKL